MGEDVRDAEVRCRNCGAPADDAYCAKCGQETRLRLPTLREFVREAAGRTEPQYLSNSVGYDKIP